MICQVDSSRRRVCIIAFAVGLLLVSTACSGRTESTTGTASAAPTSSISPSAPTGSGHAGASPSASPTNVYAKAGKGMLTATARKAVPMVYVPHTISNVVQEIDPRTYKVVRTFPTSAVAQHVVPSWDMKTLWVNESTGNRLTPINPKTGKPGKPVAVDDPYNLYFSPDGKFAMVMAERLRRIDFRDPHTMALKHSLRIPCRGVNHADFTADLTTFVSSCEFSGKLVVAPANGSRITKVIDLNSIPTPGAPSAVRARAMGGPASNLDKGSNSMPQDVRLLPDGSAFLAADMMRNGVWVLDAKTYAVKRFVPTGKGAHGIYPSRDAKVMYVSNRDEGSISVLDATTLKRKALWRLPGGGSPDMGGVTANGKQLWLTGRSDSVVYVIDTSSGKLLHKIPVKAGPHGLAVWPQPGRFSLGHTGNTR